MNLKILKDILKYLILGASVIFAITLFVVSFFEFYQYQMVQFIIVIAFVLSCVIYFYPKFRKKLISITQFVFLLSGVFFVVNCFFPVFAYYTIDEKPDVNTLPNEVLKLPYENYEVVHSSYLVRYDDPAPTKINVILGSSVDSVNGLWAGKLKAVASGAWQGEVNLDPNNKEKEWGDSISYKRTKKLKTKVKVTLPINKKHRFKWLKIDFSWDVHYPHGSGKGNKFENKFDHFSKTLNLFVISAEDLTLRIKYDKWNAADSVGKDIKSFFLPVIVVGILFIFTVLWQFFLGNKTRHE